MSGMEPQGWLQNALEELLALAPVAENDPDDAWRAVVLIARLLGSPSGPTPPSDVLRRLQALLARAGLPEPEPLLERLVAELKAEDDPAGPLLDVLLDIDDALGALSLYGDRGTARALSRRAEELLVRSAARVRPLVELATLRRATVRPDSDAAMLWDAVVQAPSAITEEVSPKVRAPTARRRPVVPLPIPREAMRPQAWTGGASLSFASEDGETRAWCYEEGGRLRLELRGTPTPPSRARLSVLRRDGALEVATTELPLEVSGNTAYADLGPVAGPESLVHALLARAGLAQEEADLRLVVMHED